MHSAHLTSSPDSSILAGDVFFHFLPAACAGYPFWSCIPGCDHSKLHGKFSFHFNFPPGIAPLSRANTLFSFSFLRRGLTLSPLLCLVVVSRTWLILLSAAWTFSFFCLFGFFLGIVGSVLHFIFRNSCVCEPFACQQFPCACCGVTVISCQSVFVGDRVCEMLKVFWCSKSRKPHTRPSLSTNKKQESATCLGARCSSLPWCSWQKHGKRKLCEKFQQGAEEWALLVSRGVLQWCVAANWWGVGSAFSMGWAGKYQMPLRLDSQCKNHRH